MSQSQREDILPFFHDNKRMDYVCAWYIKAAQMMQRNSAIKTALVSTNSICQGEMVPLLWKLVFEVYEMSIDFAWTTFRWDSESSQKAHVHCVIVGFSKESLPITKHIYDKDGASRICSNINGYLMDAPNVFVDSRTKPLCNVPSIRKGNQPTDGGNLIIDAEEYNEFIKNEPKALPFIKKLVGSKEYINNLTRYCLWLKDASPNDIKQMPTVYERVKNVREMRLASTDKGTVRLADTPHLFRETNNPNTFIIVPSVSSENRRYIPLGFMDGNTIPTNLVLIIPDATIYHFGILTSSTHMSWMRAVCGRLEMRYRYSKDIVYNNFPWPTPIDTQKEKIEKTAQAILDARALYPDSSLADLYDDLTMPVELRRAHQANDRAVMEAYGFAATMTESDIVARLLEMYEQLKIDN